ncbi:hypothetical protein HOY34_03810 [Xinfangfangia sp. D13-10-4-6]|uniref:circularly permuted type 2 ATP-grasp protein n=1 Tax=Pseudogemmobacter hezensis TaxID=2737662 RepID=UPI0015550B07|nr:circularly permuted type 2 ATP-grasp protein [Pseudogemmobacter hezensis]NPD14325.1 hypothetical protein [Pseudogemmobacter hezensis]
MNGDPSCPAEPEPRHDFGLAEYRALPGIPDELIGKDGIGKNGQVRPLWQPLLDHLGAMSSTDLNRAIDRADLYLRDSGVIYRQYGTTGSQDSTADSGSDSVERPWPLSHLPVLIDESDWTRLSAALIQRADVLEALMADLYGPNRMVAEGHLPASLLAENPQWLRPMVGITPRLGHYLHFVAFEIGRGPDGQWWVLADRTEAPSGAGYALETRVATTRAFGPQLLGQNLFGQQVHRLAGFFRDFRDHLLAMRHDPGALVAILTPGPWNETWYEQAWLARYLGISLVQGEDLTVENGRIMLRTVSGLQPIDVLWRRLDGSFADPLELDPDSRLGTPGLVSVLRQGGLSMVNPPGSGVLETRAMMAFLPRLAPLLTGEKLALPNIATWWCGGEAERAAVMAAPEQMILSPALGTGLPYDRQDSPLAAASLSPAALREKLLRESGTLVAQEAVTLSTTPALVGGKITPRPMSLRVYLARTAQGWKVMQGGFARIGASNDPAALAMQRGGAAADVWIISPGNVSGETLMNPRPGDNTARSDELPARAADNLFWLGRYVERTEAMVRLLRARHGRISESGDSSLPLLAEVNALLARTGIDPDAPVPEELLANIGRAVSSAAQLRDRFSADGWAALKDLDKSARRMAGQVWEGSDAAQALSALLRKLAGFSGLVHENMYRLVGWRFLTLGRMQERALSMAGWLAALADPDADPGGIEMCIELGDSVMTYRRRFAMSGGRGPVIDLLALDPQNPRSIRHQVDGMMEMARTLPGASQDGRLAAPARAILRLQTDLATLTPEALDSAMLISLQARLGEVSDLVSERYFR